MDELRELSKVVKDVSFDDFDYLNDCMSNLSMNDDGPTGGSPIGGKHHLTPTSRLAVLPKPKSRRLNAEPVQLSDHRRTIDGLNLEALQREQVQLRDYLETIEGLNLETLQMEQVLQLQRRERGKLNFSKSYHFYAPLEQVGKELQAGKENIKRSTFFPGIHFVESPESWSWEKKSIIHREKFIKLHEYGRDHPQKIKEVNDVRVCFSNELLIGRGSDATKVYVGLSKDGYERAVKRLQRDDCACLAEQEKKILNEPNTIESNYVVKYRFLDDKSDEDWLFLIMDLYEENLKEFVERSSSDGWPKIARDVILQVLKGLADLHRDPKRILHRDLKPSNILRNVHGKWFLADFGISRMLTQEKNTFRSKERGTKDWRAVESCSTNGMSNDGEVRYKKESDIQVAGMVAFYVVTQGEHPFGEEPDRHRNLLDGNADYLDKLEDPAAKDLISWMLSHDPKDRPSAEEALKHPYLQPAEQQFEMLCKVGNELEIKSEDNNSNVVRKLNCDRTDWKTLMNADVLKYLCTDFLNGKPKTFGYGSSWTECLRLIRNVNQHWHDRPRPKPQPEAFYLVDDPQEYFLNLFPNLSVEVHRIVRSCDWKERRDLKKYFL